MRNILAAIALVFASTVLADTYTYVDPTGVRLRLLDARCAVPEAAGQFVAHGVPPQVAATADAAEVVVEGKVIPACYLVHPSGTVFAVAPSIGSGIMALPVDAFTVEQKI